MTEPSGAGPSGLLTVTGIGVLVVGAVTVVGVLAGFVLADVDTAVRLANVCAAGVEIPLAIGVLRVRRAAWAFLITVLGTMMAFNVFAGAEMYRGGPSGQFGLALAIVGVLLFALMVAIAPEFRPKLGSGSRS